MRVRTTTVFAVLMAGSIVSAGDLEAQVVSAPASVASTGHCLMSSRVVRGATGATIGAWLGFVAAKIRMSDWSDESHTGSASRARYTATISGAALGGLVGLLVPRRECKPTVAHESTSPARLPILPAEIERRGVTGSVYDVVYSLRRNWLNGRGVEVLAEIPHSSTNENGQEVTVPGEPRIVVYLDNARLGTASALRELPITGVQAIRYYDPTQAAVRWGTNSHGVIQVVTALESGTP